MPPNVPCQLMPPDVPAGTRRPVNTEIARPDVNLPISVPQVSAVAAARAPAKPINQSVFVDAKLAIDTYPANIAQATPPFASTCTAFLTSSDFSGSGFPGALPDRATGIGAARRRNFDSKLEVPKNTSTGVTQGIPPHINRLNPNKEAVTLPDPESHFIR